MMIPDGKSSWNWDGPSSHADIRHVLDDKTVDSATLVRCVNCDGVAPAGAWHCGYVGCELCGDHSALMCPWCGYGHDGIMDTPEAIEDEQAPAFAVLPRSVHRDLVLARRVGRPCLHGGDGGDSVGQVCTEEKR